MSKSMVKSLEQLVIDEANKKVDGVTDKKALMHHNICVKLKGMAEKYTFPMGVLVYVAVGTTAHKKEVFDKGYTAFNYKKAVLAISLCKYFANHFDSKKIVSNDKLMHLVTKYISQFNDGGAMFKECVDALPTEGGIRMANFKTMKELGAYILGDKVSYDEKGNFFPIEEEVPTEEIVVVEAN